MPLLEIPDGLDALAAKLAAWRGRDPGNDLWTLFIPRGRFVTPRMLAMLTSWALEMRARGVSFAVMGDGDTCAYLDRMGFQGIIGAQAIGIPHRVEAGRFIPLFLIGTSDQQGQAVDALCELMLRQFENARELLPPFEWAVNEITDNILIHAQSSTPGVVSAQYYPGRHELEIAIVDQGLGLLGTLGPSHGARDERHAIELGLTRGLTRDPAVGQGNGMAGTELIVRENRGTMLLWTGGTRVLSTPGGRRFAPLPTVNGVGMVLRLDVRNLIDLSQTWLGERHFTYIDRQVEELEEGGFLILVGRECESVGSREPARRLRNRLMAMLPDLGDQPLIFDFSDVRDPSSSFLDELFGRIALQIGLEAFTRRCSLEGLSAASIDRANAVIHQRVTHGDALPNWEDDF